MNESGKGTPANDIFFEDLTMDWLLDTDAENDKPVAPIEDIETAESGENEEEKQRDVTTP